MPILSDNIDQYRLLCVHCVCTVQRALCVIGFSFYEACRYTRTEWDCSIDIILMGKCTYRKSYNAWWQSLKEFAFKLNDIDIFYDFLSLLLLLVCRFICLMMRDSYSILTKKKKTLTEHHFAYEVNDCRMNQTRWASQKCSDCVLCESCCAIINIWLDFE